MDLRVVTGRARPRRHGAMRNARCSLREWARAQGAVTATVERAPLPAAPSPGRAEAPSRAAPTASGH